MNRIQYWIPLAIIWLTTVTNSAVAQSSMTDDPTLSGAWTAYRSTHFDEKLFVHTDKEFYLTGELCWFKCYVVSGLTHKPLSVSKVAYVELLDTANKPLLQAKIAVDSGSGSGSLYLPFSLPSGTYTLRAYTRWMKNSPAAYFFSKSLTVVNTREAAPEASYLRADSAPVLTLFPEGGNLVAGLASTIAFRGTDAYGRPLEFTGHVLDEKGDTLVNFSPGAVGSGRFSLTPENGHTYSVVMDFTSTRPPAPGDNLYAKLFNTAPIPITIALPKVYDQGYIMHLDTNADRRLRVVVNASASLSGAVYLFAQTRGSLKLAQSQTLSGGQATFLVDPKVLGPGISHLTVFNASRQPVCERLYFKPPDGQTDFQVKALKTDFNPRDPVDIGIETGIKNADLSIAVYRVDSLQHESEENIVNYLWLTSDLGADVADPAWYYDHPEHIDDLMLTLGWRRFRWESVLSNTEPYFTYAPEYQGHIISATVVDTRTGKPVGAEKDAFLSVPGKWTQFAIAQTDAAGRVAWNFTNMYGSSEIVVQTDLEKDSLLRVDVDDPFSLDYVSRHRSPFVLPIRNPQTISSLNMSMQIQNAYVAMDRQAWVWPALDSSPFYLRPDWTYKLDDYTRFTTIEEVLREYIQLVNVQMRRNHFHIWAYDDPHKTPFLDDPRPYLMGYLFSTLIRSLNTIPLKSGKWTY